jgi:hypothetical protein
MIEVIIFYLLVIDSVGANLVAWFGEKWYTKHFRIFSRVFPAAKGWTMYYLILIMWVGFLLYRLGKL